MRIYISLLTLASLLSCTTTELKEQQHIGKSGIGDLVYGLNNQVFTDANLTTPMLNPASVGLLTQAAKHDQIWLSDGRMGWIDTAPITTKVTLDANQGMAEALLELPDNAEGPDWIDLAIDSQSKLVEISAATYPSTPPNVARQGRILFAGMASSNWPLLKVRSGNDTGWVAPADIQLRTTTPLPLWKFSGLIQKPFLSLTDLPESVLKGPTANSSYLEMADQESRIRKIPSHHWQMEQAVVPDRHGEGTTNLIVLYSAENNCNIFAIFRQQSAPTQFGYCQYGARAPTPVVDAVNYDSKGQVILDILEATGDFTETRKILIPDNFDSKSGPIKFLHGEQ